MNEAPLYSKSNAMQRHDSLHVLKRYAKLIRWKVDVDERILDVGCGDGNVTIDILMPFLPENVQKIVGMDISEDMVEFAKKHHSGDRIKFVRGDIGGKEVIDEIDEEYDHIFSFFCLHWVQNQRKSAENLYNLLKPNGDMLLTFLATNPIFDIYENLSKYETWSKYMTDVDQFVSPYHHSKDPEATYAKILREAGFNIGICKIVDRIFTFTDVGIWRKSIAAVSPFLPRIPDNLKQEYEEDFFEEVKRMNCVIRNENNNEDNIEAHYKLFVVYAYK